MGTLERRETFTHPLGPSGRLSVKTVMSTVRVRGVEGGDARVTIDYRIRAADQQSAERALDTGRVFVERGSGSLEIETPERRFATGLAWLLGGARVSADITVEVPWGTEVRLETMNGRIEAESLVGDQWYRTVSAEIRLWGLAGRVDASSVSGGITLDGASQLRLRANSISGGIRARAGTFYAIHLNTTSGSMAIVGALDPGGDFRFESISGSLDLAAVSGSTVELKTVSGSIHSEVPSRLEGGRGSWRSIAGDGRSLVKVNSTSGSVRVRRPGPGDVVEPRAAEPAPATPGPNAGPNAAVSAAAGPTGQAATDSAASAGVASPAAEAAPEPTETWDPGEAEETARNELFGEGLSDEARAEELEVLQALERGEIDVDEAATRLERVRR